MCRSRGAGRRAAGGLVASLVMAGVLVGCSDDGTSSAGPETTEVADANRSTTVPGDAAADPADEPAGGLDPEADTPADPDAVTIPPAEIPDPVVTPPADGTPTTEFVPAVSGLAKVAPKNAAGKSILLDETALLACAQNQIAWVELQFGSRTRAAEALGLAARRAETSAVPEIAGFTETLKKSASGNVSKSDVDRFLALCVSRGFEY